MVLGFWVQGLWLVWSFQGERTLSHFMKQKGFPANVAPHILPAEVSILPLTSAFCLSLSEDGLPKSSEFGTATVVSPYLPASGWESKEGE